MTGLPYAPVLPNGDRECPECGLVIPERYDRHGEATTNHYGEHYEAAHAATEPVVVPCYCARNASDGTLLHAPRCPQHGSQHGL